MIQRPMLEIERDEGIQMVEFEIHREYDNLTEALNEAKNLNIIYTGIEYNYYPKGPSMTDRDIKQDWFNLSQKPTDQWFPKQPAENTPKWKLFIGLIDEFAIIAIIIYIIFRSYMFITSKF